MKLNLVKTSDFIFRTKLFQIYDMELPFLEHIEELRQRIFQLTIIFIIIRILELALLVLLLFSFKLHLIYNNNYY